MKRIFSCVLILLNLMILSSCNIVKEKDIKLFKISTWNIGHFSKGKKRNSDIIPDKYLEEKHNYYNFISNIKSDIFFCCEYSEFFLETDEQKIYAKDAIFDYYDYNFIGSQYNYSCNSLFSKIKIDKIEIVKFLAFKDEIFSDGKIQNSDYYYLHSIFTLWNVEINLFCVHCAFDYANPSVEVMQYNELIEKSKNLDNVIIMGDFNCTNGSSGFDLFVEYGYELGNSGAFGKFKTCPSITKSDGCIDNILVKGSNISIKNAYASETSLSDHYALSCELLVSKM